MLCAKLQMYSAELKHYDSSVIKIITGKRGKLERNLERNSHVT